MSKKIQGAFLRVFVSVAAIGAIGYSLRGHLKDSFHILTTEVVWLWFLAALLGYVAVQVIMAFRLYLLYRSQGLNIPYLKTLYLCVVGLFFNLFLPSAVGGDVAKIYYTSKHTGKKIEATTAVIMDRISGFVIVIGIAALATLAVGAGELQDSKIQIIVYIFLALLISVLTFCFNPKVARLLYVFKPIVRSEKIRAKLKELYEAISSYRDKKTVFFSCLLVSLIGQTVLITLHYWIALSLNVDIKYSVFFIVIPLVSIASMAPSLGGLGVREAGAIYFFSYYMEPERALALSLLLNIIIYGLGLISGAIYALGGGLKAQDVIEVEHAAEEQLG